MPNARYARGATFERKVVDYLREKGYIAIRAAGSHGVTDIIAIRRPRILLIQCKTNAVFPVEEWNELFRLAEGACGPFEEFDVVPTLACRGDDGIEFYELLDYRKKGSRDKEMERIVF